MRIGPGIVFVAFAACGGNVVDGTGTPVPPLACAASGNVYPSGTFVAATYAGLTAYPSDVSAWAAAPTTLSWTPAPNALVDLKFDRRGAIYIDSESASGGPSRVDVFAPGARCQDQPVRAISGPQTRLNNVRALAVDGRGYIYVAEGRLGPSGGGVLVFAPEASGDVPPVRTITHSISYWLPNGLAIDNQDRVYVTDANNVPILLFDSNADGDATPLRSFGMQEAQSDIVALALGGDGTLYAAGFTTNAIYVFAPDASTATRVIPGGDAISTPIDVAVDPAGRILVAAGGGGALFAPDASGPTPLAVDPRIFAVAAVP